VLDISSVVIEQDMTVISNTPTLRDKQAPTETRIKEREEKEKCSHSIKEKLHKQLHRRLLKPVRRRRMYPNLSLHHWQNEP